jgi:hypothetical protein
VQVCIGGWSPVLLCHAHTARCAACCHTILWLVGCFVLAVLLVQCEHDSGWCPAGCAGGLLCHGVLLGLHRAAGWCGRLIGLLCLPSQHKQGVH